MAKNRTKKGQVMALAGIQPIKWHGGKAYLADWIIDQMPQRCKNPNAPTSDDPGWLHYVEPFFGGGAVLFRQDPEGISEVVNDVNSDLALFWNVLAAPSDFAEFRRIVETTPFGQRVWAKAGERYSKAGSKAERAARFFIRYRQSRQGLGDCFATLSRNRTRRGMNEQVSSWLTAIEGLPEAHARLRRVVILNDDALKVIRQQDGPRTLFYLDPPYLHETRAKSATDAYTHEMTPEQHHELLATLASIEGRFLLSGYPSKLYKTFATGRRWRCKTREIDNKSSGAKVKEMKTECLWMNY